MPLRYSTRKVGGRRIVRRRRLVRRRPVTRNLLRRSIASKVHLFKRYGATVTIASSGGIPTWADGGVGLINGGNVSADDFGTSQFGLSMKFQLNQALQASEFTALYDRYKITGVKLKFQFQQNCATVNSGGGSNFPLPILAYTFDGDDATVPSGMVEVQSHGYSKQKVLNANRPFSLYIKPRVDKLVYRSGVSNAYSSERACWLDCASLDVEHYGVKMWMRNWATDEYQQNMKLTIQPVFYLALKDTQ